ncbi:MAG: hypothetical protein K9N51_10300 [Candidatus Pacebacteria bacterium]|nr:hypothetical protein [Candidatus Paceibacterota bacterium]
MQSPDHEVRGSGKANEMEGTFDHKHNRKLEDDKVNVTISKSSKPGATVSEMILGHNIEMCITTADGLLSERLRNPKLVGPPHRMTGLAPEWQGASCGRAAYELTPGAGLLGSEAQLIRVDSSQGAPHLHQNKLSVRAGEQLEIELWARAWHEPVTLRVELRPLASRTPPYDSGEIVVDTPYYKRFTLPLKATADDDEARLFIHLANGGELWIDQIHLRPKDEPVLCKGVIDEMANMRIPTLRFPGGIVVNAYNWKHGTGPLQLRPAMLEAAFHQDWYLNYDFGLDEYLQICLDQGITPTISLNVATGTPEEAEELARYCADWFAKAGVEPPSIYWHIANHPYHYTTAHMTADMYVDVLKTFIPRVKENYPKCRVVAVMSRGDLARPKDESVWEAALLANARMIDVVEVQIYGGCSRTDSAGAQVEQLAVKLESFEQEMRAFIEESRLHDAQWNVGIAEWNWWLQASHWDGRDFEEPPTVLHGLFIAGMIHRFAAMAPDFEVAHFYNLVNCMGILNHRNADVEVTDSVEIFKLYRPALPGRFVPVEVVGQGEKQASALEAICLAADDAQWLFVVNRGLDESATISVDGFELDGAECECFRGESPLGTFSWDETVKIDEGTVDVPPLSIVRINIASKPQFA